MLELNKLPYYYKVVVELNKINDTFYLLNKNSDEIELTIGFSNNVYMALINLGFELIYEKEPSLKFGVVVRNVFIKEFDNKEKIIIYLVQNIERLVNSWSYNKHQLPNGLPDDIGKRIEIYNNL